MDNKMDFIGAADKIINFVEKKLTNELVEIYKSTGVNPSDSIEFLLSHLIEEENCEIIINKANKLIKEKSDERTSN